jgi:hypothetical protein
MKGAPSISRWAGYARRLAGKPALILTFLLCALPVGLIAAVATPPGQVQDETAHLIRAAGLLHGAVFAERRFAYDPWLHDFGWEAGVTAPVQIVKVTMGPFGHTADGRPVERAQDVAVLAAERMPPRLHLGVRFFFYIPNTAVYFPATYVPAALGLLAGAVLRHGAPLALLCARLADLIAYMALGGTALTIAAAGEPLLLAVLILPFSLFLAGSVNQDGMLIALGVFAVAALTRGETGWRRAALAALTVLAAAKPPYLPLLALTALPVRGQDWRRPAAEAVAAMALVAAIAAYNSAAVSVPFDYVIPGTATGAFYHPGPLYTGDPRAWFDTTSAADNAAALLAHPAALVSVPWRTLASWGPDEWAQMIGKFGNNPPPLAGWFVNLWVAGLLAATATSWLAAGGWPRWQGAVAVLLGAAALWLAMLGLYVSSTHVGMSMVEGFRPRYFLPVLPVLALAWPAGHRWAGGDGCRAAGTAAVLALGVIGLGYVPAQMMLGFYLW